MRHNSEYYRARHKNSTKHELKNFLCWLVNCVVDGTVGRSTMAVVVAVQEAHTA